MRRKTREKYIYIYLCIKKEKEIQYEQRTRMISGGREKRGEERDTKIEKRKADRGER